MKHHFFFTLFLFSCLFLSAQQSGLNLSTNKQAEEKGIQWVNDLNWQQVVAKAKSENKFIFVDCYATWCGPCKLMDKDVYPQKVVGDFANSRFISVKVQMDKTDKDVVKVREWYNDAATLSSQ